jgi:hypothetical protein
MHRLLQLQQILKGFKAGVWNFNDAQMGLLGLHAAADFEPGQGAEDGSLARAGKADNAYAHGSPALMMPKVYHTTPRSPKG